MNLRRVGMASIGALVLQLLLGVSTSLWVTVALVKPWSHIGNVALLVVHGLVGVAITAMSFVVIQRAFEVGSRAAKRASLAAVVGNVGALGCGVGFVWTGGCNAYALGMALGWSLALLSDVVLALGW